MDAINYYGKTVGNNNLVNRGAVNHLIDSAVNQAITNAAGLHPYYAFTYSTGTTGAGQFRAFAAGSARKIQISSTDIYGRTTPNHTSTNGFHIGDPWVTIEDTTTGMLVFGAKLKYGHPSYSFQNRNFFYDTSDIQYQDITLNADNVPQFVAGRTYIIRCAGIL